MKNEKNNYLDDFIKSREYNFNFDDPWKGELPLDTKYVKYPKLFAWSNILSGLISFPLVWLFIFVIGWGDDLTDHIFFGLTIGFIGTMGSLLILAGIRNLRRLKKRIRK